MVHFFSPLGILPRACGLTCSRSVHGESASLFPKHLLPFRKKSVRGGHQTVHVHARIRVVVFPGVPWEGGRGRRSLDPGCWSSVTTSPLLWIMIWAPASCKRKVTASGEWGGQELMSVKAFLYTVELPFPYMWNGPTSFIHDPAVTVAFVLVEKEEREKRRGDVGKQRAAFCFAVQLQCWGLEKRDRGLSGGFWGRDN